MAADENKDAKHGRSPDVFSATHWSIIKRAQDKSEAAFNSLFERYRNPLLAYIRRSWPNAPNGPEDIVQEFYKGLWEREFLKSVSPAGGKFRTFLLNSLQNHLRAALKKANAEKRGGGQVLIPLNKTDGEGNPLRDPAAPGATPDLEYDRDCAHTLLAKALDRLRAECAPTGHATLCAELEPVLFADETAPSYREIAERLAMTEGSVRVAAHRIRVRLKGIIRDEIMQTVDNEEDFESELRQLFASLGN